MSAKSNTRVTEPNRHRAALTTEPLSARLSSIAHSQSFSIAEPGSHGIEHKKEKNLLTYLFIPQFFFFFLVYLISCLQESGVGLLGYYLRGNSTDWPPLSDVQDEKLERERRATQPRHHHLRRSIKEQFPELECHPIFSLGTIFSLATSLLPTTTATTFGWFFALMKTKPHHPWTLEPRLYEHEMSVGCYYRAVRHSSKTLIILAMCSVIQPSRYSQRGINCSSSRL